LGSVISREGVERLSPCGLCLKAVC
jgi:hypothetical protein